MSFTTHPATSTLPIPTERKPSRLVRLVHAIVAARTRIYLAVITDPATGRIATRANQVDGALGGAHLILPRRGRIMRQVAKPGGARAESCLTDAAPRGRSRHAVRG